MTSQGYHAVRGIGARRAYSIEKLQVDRVCAKMSKCCVAAGCSNTYKSGISLFLFPKDPQLCKNWTDQVKRTRYVWEGPFNHSRMIVLG